MTEEKHESEPKGEEKKGEKVTEVEFNLDLAGLKSLLKPVVKYGIGYGLIFIILAVLMVVSLIYTYLSIYFYSTLALMLIFSVLSGLFTKHKAPFYALLFTAIILGLIIRTASLPALGATPLVGNNYLGMGGSLTGLDPYEFYDLMKDVIATGNVPVINHLQYLPIGLPSRSQEILISFFGAYMYRFLAPIVPAATPMTWFMIYPPIVAVIMTIILFFILLYIFKDYWMASLGALVFPAFETLLGRTSAGFSTKTAMGFMFIFLSLFMLVKIFTSKDRNSKLLYGFLMAISVGFGAITSGYAEFSIIIIPLTYLLLIMFEFDKKEDLYAFLPFGLFLAFEASFLNFSLSNLLSFELFPMYFVYLVILFKLFVYDRYRDRLKIPYINEGTSPVVYALLIGFVISLLPKLNLLHKLLSFLSSEISHPLGLGAINPLSLTIAEYGSVNLANRFAEYNFVTAGGIGVNFLLLFIGSSILLYLISRRFKHWYIFYSLLLPVIVLINGGVFSFTLASEVYLLVAVIMAAVPEVIALYEFSKHRSKKLLGNVAIFVFISIVIIAVSFALGQSKNYYKYGTVGLIGIFLLFLVFDKFERESVSDKVYLILITLFSLTIVLSNLELRLLEPTDITAVLLVPLAVVFLTNSGIKYIRNIFKEKASRRALYALIGLVVIIALTFTAIQLYSSLTLSYQIEQQSGSGLALWGPTMLWINQNTPANSSIISWWDYGYWEQAIAGRTSVADGSNAYGYQSMIAKYFFEATSPYQYATYLHFIHEPTYAVISGSEVLKFSAISTIALKPTEFSPLVEGATQLNSNNLGNKSYKYIATFGGTASTGYGLIDSNLTVGLQNIPASNAILLEALFPFNITANSNLSIGAPYGIVYNTLTQQASSPMPIDYFCTYSEGCIQESTSGIPGGIMLLLPNETATLHIGGVGSGYIPESINLSAFGNKGAALFIPNKTLNTLFVKLYLLNETVPGFKLVFSDNLPVNSLLSIENQVLTNINVYQINYTELSKYELTGECSISPSAVNYCDNLSYLPSVFSRNLSLINSTGI
ncbi:MAG: hypothetical protein OH316_01815 [Candidatus Parvarchaeota archaeon]|nr:hypothetical protein [Candidatus Parvarchaeota archaeon]MCW1301850.1 hypothetical protein [Candidatus Parvarchaeota archaeon]